LENAQLRVETLLRIDCVREVEGAESACEDVCCIEMLQGRNQKLTTSTSLLWSRRRQEVGVVDAYVHVISHGKCGISVE